MTDAEVLRLKAGDTIAVTMNGTTHRKVVEEVRWNGTCDNPQSGAHGHAYAGYTYRLSDRCVIETSLHSDEYTRGQGYQTHDANGQRLFGWELVQQ